KGELTPEEQEYCDRYDRMFGSQRWRAIVERMSSTIWDDAIKELPLDEQDLAEARGLEEELAGLYRDSLLAADPSVIVKSIRLLFPAHNLSMYYLYLTTHNPYGALKMNELIWEANLLEYRLRERLKQAKKQAKA